MDNVGHRPQIGHCPQSLTTWAKTDQSRTKIDKVGQNEQIEHYRQN